MGLFGVANGIDGDLRPGLPSQMIEVHDPVRLLMVVEHLPQVVLDTIKKNPATYQWFENEWVVLVASDPETGHMFIFRDADFRLYEPESMPLGSVSDINDLLEHHTENLPVILLKD